MRRAWIDMALRPHVHIGADDASSLPQRLGSAADRAADAQAWARGCLGACVLEEQVEPLGAVREHYPAVAIIII